MIGSSRISKMPSLSKARRRIRLFYLTTLRQSDTPENIALGAAIGVAAGILPTFGLGAVMALGISCIVRANKVAAVLGSFIMNPITTPLFWGLSSTIGGIIFWEDRDKIFATLNNHDFFGGFKWAFLVFMVGNVIVSAFFSIFVYLLMKRLVIRRRKRRLAKINPIFNSSTDSNDRGHI